MLKVLWMRCVALPVRGIGVLEVCASDGRIQLVRLRVGVDGVHANVRDEFIDLVMRYLDGLLGPQELVRYVELGSGLLGLIQLAMLSIPRGRVAAYSQIARLLNTSPRAVGRLAGANRLPVIVPCHRVVRSDGSLGGYSIGGVRVKMGLLMMEGVNVVNGRVPRQYFVDDATLIRNFRELLELVSHGVVT